jgi:tetratricopeptide (TPR) repeat protein
MIAAPWGERMDSNFEQARLLFLSGVQAYEAGRLPEAERHFAAALALVPGRPSVLTNLGAVRLKPGRAEEALAVLEEALAQEPDNAEALGHGAPALAELGRRDHAAASFRAALTGVDLSPRMLEKAGALGAYDGLQQADVTEFLRASREQFDLVVAADVFIYAGVLDDLFALLAQRMDAAAVSASRWKRRRATGWSCARACGTRIRRRPSAGWRVKMDSRSARWRGARSAKNGVSRLPACFSGWSGRNASVRVRLTLIYRTALRNA